MPQFTFRHHNRTTYPTRHILVCEDDLSLQARIMAKLSSMFEHQGHVQVTLVCGGLGASAVIHWSKVDLIILDHDMPEGNGTDLIGWLKQEGKMGIPILTFSGIDANNAHMGALGARHVFSKEAVLAGEADALILGYVG